MVGRDGVDALGQALEAPFVRRQDLLDVQVPHLGQRVQVVLERGGRLTALDRDVRRDPRQDVVTGEEPAGSLVDEAQVARGMARRVQGTQLPAGHIGQVPVGQRPVG